MRRQVQTLLNGYIQSPLILERMDDYLVPPSLGKRSGVLSAIAMAMAIRPLCGRTVDMPGYCRRRNACCGVIIVTFRQPAPMLGAARRRIVERFSASAS